MEDFIEYKDLTKAFGQKEVLRGVNLRVRRGETVVILGGSGSGKSVLIRHTIGLHRPDGGEVWVDGTPVHSLSSDQAAQWRGRTLGVVFQSFELLPTLTVLQNVMLPMDFANRYPVREQPQRALNLLKQVGIVDHALKLPSALSGGQQQRVAIARALANDPTILVADEPTGSLDSLTAGAVIEVFEGLAAQGRTILLVTHDRDIAQRGSRVITLLDGEIVDEREGSHA